MDGCNSYIYIYIYMDRKKWKKYRIVQMTGDIIMIIALFGWVFQTLSTIMGLLILGSGLGLHTIGWIITPKEEKSFDWSGIWNLGGIS